MKAWGRAALWIALAFAAAAGPCWADAQSSPPVMAFASLPALSYPELSPDGRHFAAIQSFNGKPAAVIYTVNAGPNDKPVVIPSSEWLIQYIRWAKNDRLLLFLGMNKRVGWDSKDLMRSWGRTVSVSVDGTDAVVLFKGAASLNNNVRATSVVDYDLGDSAHVFMPLLVYDSVADQEDVGSRLRDEDKSYFRDDLFQVDIRTGKAERSEAGSLDTSEWYMDGNGHVVARIDQSSQPLQDHLKIMDRDAWREVGVFDASADKGADVWGISQDGLALVHGDQATSDRKVLKRYDLVSGSDTELFADPNYDVGGPIEDEWTGRIVGVEYKVDKSEYRYFDSKLEALQRGLEQAFPGLSVRAVSSDVARNRVIAAVEGPRTPPSYYEVDRSTHQATLIGSTYPDLKESDLGEMKSYPFVARDGLPIPAYITLPPGRAPKNLPAIVMPHGGPDARDEVGFDWWAQFLANRGYVVLQPNYRGSEGYGHKFVEAGLHQWGMKMQDDVSDGVKKMIADGIADPKRICIVGGSYGGYAALAGATLTPDLYACAVSVAGVSDLPQMLADERHRFGVKSGVLSFWISRIGSPVDDSEQLRATSPARHADQVKCPVLLMHGDGDSTVPIKQSELMANALKKAGKPVEFVTLEGDDHYLELGATRVKLLTEIERFLKQHIGS